MLTYYTDIPRDELEDFRDVIEEQDGVRCNNDMTRCIIKWQGATPQKVLDGGYTVRNHADALAYYNDPDNGWVVPGEDPPS
jgi:hypothetical protein